MSHRVWGSIGAKVGAALSLLAGGTGAFALDGPAAKPRSEAEQAAVAHAIEVSTAFQVIARDVTPAVVSIQAMYEQRGGGMITGDEAFDELLRRHFQGDEGAGPPVRRGYSTGSGVIVSADGYVLTNNHVVDRATRVKVQLDDDRQFDAKVIGTDPETDVAVLKIEGTDLPHVKLGDSDEVNIGEMVVAIGSPFGLSQTVTSGIISAKGRRISGPSRGNVTTRFEDFLQTDASVNPGNSGGPLVNLRGEVIGVNTAIFSRSGGSVGIGFAIPINMARSVMESLINTGKVQRGWLGVSYQPLSEQLAKMVKFNGAGGVYVASVVPGSPAESAGLKADDVITEINGRPVKDADAFRARIATLPPDREVALVVYRDGERTSMNAKLGSAAAALAATDDTTSADNPLGVSVRTVTDEIREELGDRRAAGVVILDVKRGSAAAQLGMQPGDVLFELDRTAIEGVESFKKAVAGVNLRRGVRIGIRRNGNDQTAFVQINR